MIELLYRDVTQNDIGQLLDLMLELGYTIEKAELSDRIDLITAQGGKLLVAEKSGLIVGAVQALIDVRLAEGKLGEIVSLIVTKNERGRGIGKKLFIHAKMFLVSEGCESVRVRANSIRKDAHDFYKSLGFEKKKTQKIFVVNDLI